MRCLVTGAAGFIGSHLAQTLLSHSHQVIGVDNFVTGRSENIPFKNEHNFHFKQQDFAETDCSDVDWVFHLAALADIVPSIEKPEAYHRNNVTGTLSLLESARKAKVKRFIYAASSSCYGIPDAYPTPESSPLNPMYPYALTKMAGESYVLHWARVFKLPALSLRLFNVYGPRHRTNGTYGAMFGTWLAQMANDQPITIVGDGSQSRDFTFVDDVVNAFILAAQSSVVGEAINIGSGAHISVANIANLLEAPRRIHIPKRPGEPEITYADIRKAERLLGYNPKISIKDGCWVMKSIIGDYKNAPVWTPEKIEVATKAWFECLEEK